MSTGTAGVGYKTPKDVVVMTMNAALVKASFRWERLFALGFLAGAYISIGALLATIITGGMYQQVGVEKLVGGAVFPVGLICVIIAGGELFTGNCAVLIPSWLCGRITTRDVLRLANAIPANACGVAQRPYFINMLATVHMVTQGHFVDTYAATISSGAEPNPLPCIVMVRLSFAKAMP
eukprot:1176080-Prorocentrum_minimum.AAC.3